MSDWVRMRAERRAERSRLGRADIVGEHAIQIVEVAYMRSQFEDVPQTVRDGLREWICIARGWEFAR